MESTTVATNIKPGINLLKGQGAFTSFLLIILVFIILLGVLYAKNPSGFGSIFSYEILFTIPMTVLIVYMLYQYFVFKESPTKSLLSSLPGSSASWFPTVFLLGIGAVAISVLFSIFAMSGFLSDNPPANNGALLTNVLVLMVFTVFASMYYLRGGSKGTDSKGTGTGTGFVSEAAKHLEHLRTKYTMMFVVYIVLVTLLYFYNPGGIMSKYGGLSTFFVLFVGLIFVAMITVYQNGLARPNDFTKSFSPTFLTFMKGFYIIGALFISGLLIYGLMSVMGLFNQDASKPRSWPHFIINIILFIAMLALIYRIANAGGFLDQNPLYRLILNTLLYIPCLLTNGLNWILTALGIQRAPGATGPSSPPPTKTEIIVLLVSIALLAGYFLTTKYAIPFAKSSYYKKGGKQLVNEPIPIGSQTNVASYQTLNDSDKLDYKYAISFWYYMDSFPPSTNAAYTHTVPILSYGENPMVKYNSSNNTLYVTVKKNGPNENDNAVNETNTRDVERKDLEQWAKSKGERKTQDKGSSSIRDAIEEVKQMYFEDETDGDGHRIIWQQPDVLLQKWNNVVLNYNGGTLDIFYNGKLVKSSIGVVPYIKYDLLTVGSENGVSGNLANLMYFKEPLDVITIDRLYNSLKDKNPPSI